METNKQKIPFMVCVRCFTFNHAHYIEDAMNGFCMQETTFPFVCTIIDDASTDGEPEVIKKYLQRHFDLDDKTVTQNEETDDYVLTFARHKTNQNCYFAVLYLKYNHYNIKKAKKPYVKEWFDTKYTAICEGDDYWIDRKKLQKQIVFLEQNPQCYLCGTNGIVLWEGLTQHPRFFKNDFESHWYSLTELIGFWAFPTASLVVRTSIYTNYPEWTKKIYSGDMSLILISAYKSEAKAVYTIGDITCVYRRDDQAHTSLSMVTNKEKELQHHYVLYDEFNKYTNYQYESFIKKHLNNLHKREKYIQVKKSNPKLFWLIMPFFCLENLYQKIGRRIYFLFHKYPNFYLVKNTQ